MSYILNNFLYKVFIALIVISMVGSSQLNAMKRWRELSPVPSELKVVTEYMQDHKETTFKIYMNLQLVENCPLPLDVVSVISFDAYILSIILELSENLMELRNYSGEALNVIKRLHDTYGFNVSVQMLKMALKQAKMSLSDIQGDYTINLIERVCMNGDSNDIKLIFAVTDDKIQAMISTKDYLGMTSFHNSTCNGYIKDIRVMLDAFGDKAQDLIALKNRFDRTALDEAKILKNDNTQYFDVQYNIDEVITLLESYQHTNQ